jgi:hypothetical protein
MSGVRAPWRGRPPVHSWWRNERKMFFFEKKTKKLLPI